MKHHNIRSAKMILNSCSLKEVFCNVLCSNDLKISIGFISSFTKKEKKIGLEKKKEENKINGRDKAPGLKTAEFWEDTWNRLEENISGKSL